MQDRIKKALRPIWPCQTKLNNTAILFTSAYTWCTNLVIKTLSRFSASPANWLCRRTPPPVMRRHPQYGAFYWLCSQQRVTYFHVVIQLTSGPAVQDVIALGQSWIDFIWRFEEKRQWCVLPRTRWNMFGLASHKALLNAYCQTFVMSTGQFRADTTVFLPLYSMDENLHNLIHVCTLTCGSSFHHDLTFIYIL